MTTKGSFAKRKIELPRSQPGGTRTSPCRQTRAERIGVLNPTRKRMARTACARSHWLRQCVQFAGATWSCTY